MVIRETHVSVVEEPHISHIKDLISLHLEELLEVLNWLDQVTEPNHGWEIGLLSLEEGTSKLDRLGGSLLLGLYKIAINDYTLI